MEDKEKLQDGVAKMIMEGETYKDVVARNPGCYDAEAEDRGVCWLG